RYSRHRWTVLKLPPRRMERRLTAAANWFSEQLSRHWVGRLDLLFTSEAMNLASLLRLMPQLAPYPSVVYFHHNQLPDLSSRLSGREDSPLDLVNLNTAQAATEIWFNSAYHRQTFMILAQALVARYPELSARDPMPGVAAKVRTFAPPIDLNVVHGLAAGEPIARDPRTVYVETRDADVSLLNAAVVRLRQLNVPIRFVTVGPVVSLDPGVDRLTVSEYDEVGQARAMLGAGIVLSVKPEAAIDHQVVRALAAGCRPVLPAGGVYPELLPEKLHKSCLYDVFPDRLADKLSVVTGPSAVPWRPEDARPALRPFDPMAQCRAIDERIEQIVAQNPGPG
ncbi:MAG TPA: DUF3524 domain-containing protein, partial [Humisphaera sp.]